MAGYVVLSKQFVGPSDGSSNVGAFLLARQLIASAVMLALAACRHGCLLPRPEHRGVLGRLGFLNFVNAIGFVWGVKLTTAFVTSVLQLSIPVLTLLYSTLAGLEQPSATKGGALLLTLLGCVLVAVGSAGEQAAAAAAGGDGPDDPSPRGALSLVVGVAILVAQCTSFVGLVVTRGPPVRRRRAAGPVPRGPAWRPSRTQGAPALDRSPRSPAWARPTAARTSLRCRTVARRQKRLLDFYPVTLVVGWSYALCTAWSAAYCVLDRSLLRLPELLSTSGHGLPIILYSAHPRPVASRWLALPRRAAPAWRRARAAPAHPLSAAPPQRPRGAARPPEGRLGPR